MSYKTYEQYVDSNIDWIGKIPEHWNITPLKRFVILHNGKEITNEVEADDENAIGVYGSGGLFKYTDEYLFKGESVLFGRKGTLGKPLYLNDIFWTVDTMYYLSFNKYLLPKYCYYCLISYPWDKISTETAKPSVVGTDVTNSMFAIPNIVEQKQITNYLDKKTAKIDSTIAKNEELIELLEEKRVALINQVVTKGLNPDVPMKDSGVEWIGEIPEHWDFIPVNKFSSYITDYVANGSFASLRENVDYLDEEDYAILVRLIDNSNNFNGPFVYINEDSYNFLSKTKLKEGDIVLANIGATLGTIFKVPNLDKPMSLGPNVLLIRFKNNINGDYFLNLIDSKIGKCFIDSITTQTTQPKFNKTELRKLRILHPPLKEQEQINNEINKINQAINTPINKIKEQIILLKEYKTSLIHHVVTGKIDVRGEKI